MIVKNLLLTLSLTCAVIFASAGISWGQNVMFDELVKRDGLYYKRFSATPGVINVPFTGEVRVGRRGGEGLIRDGKREGAWTKYFPNGVLLQKQTYKDGVLEGPWLIYYVTGQLRSEKTYKEGKLEGPWLHYSVKGELESVETYKNGILQ